MTFNFLYVLYCFPLLEHLIEQWSGVLIMWLQYRQANSTDKGEFWDVCRDFARTFSTHHIPCTFPLDYFYLEHWTWYHFSKWESASAAWVIHLGSSDNFLWNMCVLFIPVGTPQHKGRDEYHRQRNKAVEQFVIKGILCQYTHSSPPLCSHKPVLLRNAITDAIWPCSTDEPKDVLNQTASLTHLTIKMHIYITLIHKRIIGCVCVRESVCVFEEKVF